MNHFHIQRDLLLLLSQMLLTVGNDDYGPVEEYPSPFADVASEEMVKRLLLLNSLPPILTPDELCTRPIAKGEKKDFFYLLNSNEYNVSVTVTPCTSTTHWSVRYRNEENTGQLYHPPHPEETLAEYTTNTTETFIMPYARQGLYTIRVTSIEDSYVQIYLSLEDGGPKLFQLTQTNHELKLRKNELKRKLSIKWNSSNETDPDLIKYFVVINTRKFYKSLCEARSDLPRSAMYVLPINHSEDAVDDVPMPDNDLTVESVGHATNYIKRDMEFGKTYFVNIFAMDITELSVPYANGSILYQKPKPYTLKDGVATVGNVKKNNGQICFRYKVTRRAIVNSSNADIWLYVLPCGGVVNVEIRHKKRIIIAQTRVSVYRKFLIPNAIKGSRYFIRISVVSKEETRHFKHVEVFATMRPQIYPFLELPAEVNIREYQNPRSCNSTVIGWMPVLSPASPVIYCVYLREDIGNETLQHTGERKHFRPNQCKLDEDIRRLKQNFAMAMCKEVLPASNTTREVITQKIENLKADQDYLVQVVARRRGHRSLSYNILRLRTNGSCL